MLATQVILCVTLIGNIALLTVVLHERVSLLRTVFAIYLASLTAWTFAIYLNLFLKSLFVESCIFATAAASLTLQLWFAKLFPRGKIPRQVREYWSLAVGCFFLVASFYPGAMFNLIEIHQEGYTILDNGFLSAEYSVFALVYVCAPILIFFLKYRSSQTRSERVQLRYLAIGFALFAAIALLTNSVLPVFFHIYRLNAIGPAFSLLFATFVFYVIWKHDFLDIRRAVQRGAIYSLLIAFIVATYIILLFLFDRDFSPGDDLVQPLSAMLVTLFGVFTIPFLERYFQKFTDRFFFKDRYDYATALEALAAILHASTDFRELIVRVEAALRQLLRAESANIVLYSQGSPHPDIRATFRAEFAARTAIFEPISIDGKEIGGILVKEKLSGDSYGNEDMRLLHAFALQAATALARAKLFLQVQKHASELEDKVAERTAQLKRAHESERHMIQDIAHGLQTPLTIFRTNLEQLRSAMLNELSIDVFEQSLSDFSSFIENLLQLAHIEHASESRDLSVCCISDLLTDLLEELTVIATAQGISMEHQVEKDIFVSANASQLRSAIMNPVSNAIKYMGKEGPKNIRISLTRERVAAVLSIRDTGVGISEKDLPHIFDRFYRGNAGGDGGGLGLAISKNIIEKHGGTITADSKVGAGTVVTIRLPCLEVTQKAA
jgi:signal transduction histidine kinase